MAQKTVAIIMILLFLSAGFFIGSLASGFVGQLTVPSSHKAIVDNMTIKAGSATLTPSYLSTGKTKWQLSTLTENFEKYGTYQYSLWVYSFEGDPEVYVCIWGPGKDGKTYEVELAASYPRDFTVKYGGTTESFTTDHILAVEVG